jgi:hypothetical protein
MTKETFHLGTIKIAMDGTSGYFGPTILDKYATHLSELKDCGAPLLEESPNYLASFVLNRTFTNPLPDPQGGTLFLFGRRILHAANEYKLGRDLLLAYVQKLSYTNTHFLQATIATTHFEQCVASSFQASSLFGTLVALAGQPKIDDDLTKRLKLIWNRSKHFDEDILKRRVAVDFTAPVWITNTGISSTKATVSFEELHSFLSKWLGVLKGASDDLNIPTART